MNSSHKKTFIGLLFVLLQNTLFSQTTTGVVISKPADVTVECNAIPSIKRPATTTTCENKTVTVTAVETRQNGSCANNFVLIRTWTATDVCKNTATVSQKITVLDTRPPVIASIPSNTTVECSNVPVALRPAVSDLCDKQPILTIKDTRIAGLCPDSYRLQREWTATDVCGNSAVKTQIITVQDITKPVFSNFPADVTVDCASIPAKVTPTATDNCDNQVSISMFERRVNGICPSNYTLRREYTASDNCGNFLRQTQTITVIDNKTPQLVNIPTNVTVDCALIPTAAPTATDNCTAQVTIKLNETKSTISASNCPYVLRREWTATDNCNNTATGVQLITVQDTKAPKFTTTLPDNVTVSCSQVPTLPKPTAMDNCDADLQFSLSETKSNSTCPDTYKLTRTWTVADKCGNTATLIQVINVQDIIAPYITNMPPNITMSCNNLVPAISTTVAIADNCSTNVNVSVKETKTEGNCSSNYILKREWTATDACGNKATRTQSITVRDILPPTFMAIPQNVTVECDKLPTIAPLKVVDNCSTNIVSNVEITKVLGDCPNAYVLLVRWTASDECGNARETSQMITVRDRTAPYVETLPAATTIYLNCGAQVPAKPNVVFKDKCSGDVTVKFTEEAGNQDNPNCADKTIIRRWVATDVCNNSAELIQTIKFTVIGLIKKDNQTVDFQNNTLTNNDLEVFPNPTSGILNISFSDKVQQIRLIDEVGKVHYANTNPITGEVIDLSNQQTGIYYIQAIKENSVITKKIILSK